MLTDRNKARFNGFYLVLGFSNYRREENLKSQNMKPIKQKYIHIPERQHGDCWRTCIASILECDVDTFPCHNGDISWPDEYDEMIQILESMGYAYKTIPINYVTRGILDCPDTDGYSIAIGKSNRGFNHSVVWKNGIVHDPHPDNTGISEITRFEVITKISSTESSRIEKPSVLG